MPYVPTFGGNSLGVGPAIEAIIPASILSAAIGMCCLGVWALVSFGSVPVERPELLLAGLFLGGLALAVGTIAATFVIAFYLCIFGLPVAILLGERIRHPLALAVSLGDALIGTIVATTGSKLGLFGRADSFDWSPVALVLCFAIPAGYLYRRNIIAARDVAEFA